MTRTIWLITAVALAAGTAADVIVDASVPGFTATLGFVGCAVIIYASKWLGKRLLQRPETYWTRPEGVEGLPDG